MKGKDVKEARKAGLRFRALTTLAMDVLHGVPGPVVCKGRGPPAGVPGTMGNGHEESGEAVRRAWWLSQMAHTCS